MTVWDFLSALLRRWYIAIPLAILVVLGVRWFVDNIEGEYRYDAIVRMEYDQGEVAEYLEVPVNLRSLIQALQLSVSDDGTANKLEDAGLTAWYRVRVLDFARRPILEITTEDPNEVVAFSTLNALHEELESELRRLQIDMGAPENDLVVLKDLESTIIGEPELEMSSRAQLALVGAAIVIYGLVLATIDRLLTAVGSGVSRANSGRSDRRSARKGRKAEKPVAAVPGLSMMNRNNS